MCFLSHYIICLPQAFDLCWVQTAETGPSDLFFIQHTARYETVSVGNGRTPVTRTQPYLLTCADWWHALQNTYQGPSSGKWYSGIIMCLCSLLMEALRGHNFCKELIF